MLGVVIWSAETESKAIIWCEDHGELAFFGQPSNSASDSDRLDEGDLIQFDLTEFSNMRVARNPKRVAHHFCSDVGNVIATAGQVMSSLENGESQCSGIVVDLNEVKNKRAAKQIERAAS